jgi:hypothetical protein
MISSLNGGDLNAGFNDNLGCDMAELLQRGAPQSKFYRGHRDLALMMYAGAFNYVLVGLTVQSAYKTLSYNNLSAWLAV